MGFQSNPCSSLVFNRVITNYNFSLFSDCRETNTFWNYVKLLQFFLASFSHSCFQALLIYFDINANIQAVISFIFSHLLQTFDVFTILVYILFFNLLCLSVIFFKLCFLGLVCIYHSLFFSPSVIFFHFFFTFCICFLTFYLYIFFLF